MSAVGTDVAGKVPGVRYGKYHLIARFPAEGLGEVYLAAHPGGRVVVRRLLADEARNTQIAHAFQHEARVAARIHHPNAPRIFEQGRLAGEYFVVREHLEAPTLGESIAKARTQGRYLPVDWVLDVVASILDVLAFAHERGVVHGQLSARRIRASQNGAVQVTGFGSSLIDPSDEETPYSAPELLASKRRTPASDVFAVATLLFEALTNHRPCDADEQAASRTNAAVPGPLDALIRRALSLDPKLRPTDARSFLSMLVGIRAAITEESGPDGEFVGADLPDTFPIPMPGVPSRMETDEIVRPTSLGQLQDDFADGPDTMATLEALMFDRPAAPIASHVQDFPVWIRDADYNEIGPQSPSDALRTLAQLPNDLLVRTVVSPDHQRWLRSGSWARLLGAPLMRCPPMPPHTHDLSTLHPILSLRPTGVMFAEHSNGERHLLQVEAGEIVGPLDPAGWLRAMAMLAVSTYCQEAGAVQAIHRTLEHRVGIEEALSAPAANRIQKVLRLMLARRANEIRSWPGGRVIMIDRAQRLDNQTVRA